ncbi:succinyldiaminopimelate transaminase [Methylotenera sp.]|uniref:succinyldiaminopimelate transaminase n=1 Tax=Methylotenera sp. TaxID=2051956 RepID=UPI00271CBE5C|nr:succinyldiaminopimelate transaminase [Methylotenera sp.]MDO9204434.1 succinyldiaminopimelate transaminase [Methylotenera sp.]MDO9392900.1 succinyldiaminopimelate transaminase [Methylotenera sp.]MDP1521961.1 succinyldiaminopimelate transaminase [Methylotenera sp.]MDP2072181.1 succinyldiaminopimelate transaminase [Methylotenera sp.]MDP3006808.1 succinyldiaminopimelate transaminase [Methylotenera sp.]
MNPNLNLLQPYPFQRLRDLFKGTTPNVNYSAINLSIGEPKHATPHLIKDALVNNLSGLASYPTTIGSIELRTAISNWISRRYGIPAPNPDTSILPVTGSREALFAFAQVVIDSSKTKPIVISPNPFYQIYEGAAFLAGAEPYFLNTLPENQHAMDFESVPVDVLNRTQLVYICSPGNPSGKVMSLDQWKTIFELSDKYGFIIAADECYSEIYFDEATPPLGALQAAHKLGRDYNNLIIFSSLSKRSNVPGMRSGFVAGDVRIIEKFALYRTYHGCAMNPAVQAASMTAWNDEAHVIENRRLYAEKFKTVTPLLKGALAVEMPDAAFYLWAKINQANGRNLSDTEFALRLYREFNVTVLPGSYLAREAHGINPGQNFVRLALVANLNECVEAANRIQKMCDL